MLFVLAVLLLHPPAAPAAVLHHLPLNSLAYSGAVVSPLSADDPTDKKAGAGNTAADEKTAADKKTPAEKAPASKPASNTQANSSAQVIPPAVVFPPAASVSAALSAPAVSPDPVAATPGQLVLTSASERPADGDVAGFSSSVSAAPAFRAAAYYPKTEGAAHAHVLPPKKWLILSAAEHGAATFDAYSTRQAIMSGAGQELNPMLRPFANSNALFAAVQVAPVLFDYVSLRMMRNSHPLVRRMWWVPQSASTATSLFAGAHNMALR